MKNSSLKNVPLWKMAIRLGGLFIVIVVIIQFFWEWIKQGNLDFIPQSFQNGDWLNYAISKLFLGIVYGFVTAYFLKRNVSKRK